MCGQNGEVSICPYRVLSLYALFVVLSAVEVLTMLAGLSNSDLVFRRRRECHNRRHLAISSESAQVSVSRCAVASISTRKFPL